MSFVLAILEYKTAIIFYSLVFLIVYLNRKKFDVHGKFIYLYRTKIGINLMNRVAKKTRRLLKFFGYISIIAGFAGMIFTFVFLLNLAYKSLLNVPGVGGVSPVIPGFPIVGTGIVFPLITGWIAIFIIIVVHEFSHGFVAKAHNIEIKHSGIAFFGPILGAFVEPNEKKLMKQKDSVQHSVFGAGPFSNLILTVVAYLIYILIFSLVINNLVVSLGVIVSPQSGFPAEQAGITNDTLITQVNGVNISTLKGFQEIMQGVNINETVTLSSLNQTFFVKTTENPENPSQAYLGILIQEDVQLRNENIFTKTLLKILGWFLSLLYWVGFLSLNIGLINLLPIFLTDGARMLKVGLDRIIPDKKQSISIWLFINWIGVFLLIILLFLPFFRWLGSILTNILI